MEGFEIIHIHVELSLITTTTTKFGSFNQSHKTNTYFDKWSHQPSRKIEVGNVGHQTGIIVVHVRGPLAPHVRGLPVKSVWRRPKIRVLWPSPGRMLADSRMRQSVTRMMMRRSNFCGVGRVKMSYLAIKKGRQSEIISITAFILKPNLSRSSKAPETKDQRLVTDPHSQIPCSAHSSLATATSL